MQEAAFRAAADRMLGERKAAFDAMRIVREIQNDLREAEPEIDEWYKDLGAGAGEAGGEAAAESFVPAFVEEMQRREEIQQVIKRAVEAREVNWSDVSRLYQLRADGIAQDFAAALQGRASDIGRAIEEALEVDARQKAREAAMEFTEGFESGLGDLRGAIDDALGAISDWASAVSIEDAQLQLDILNAELEATEEIAKLEDSRQNVLDEIARIEQDAADAVAEQERELTYLNDLLVAQKAEIEKINIAADYQIDVIQDQIDANERLLDSLNDQLAAKRENLAADREALRTYEEAARAQERALTDAQRGLESAVGERARAWETLGMAPGGGALPVTLLDAARDLKRLQDELADMLGAESDATASDRRAVEQRIAEAQALFDQLDADKQAEIATLQDQVAQQQALLAVEQERVAQAQAAVEQSEREIETIQDRIDTVKESIEADKERIDAIKQAAEDEIDAVERQIETTEEAIRTAEARIQTIKDEAAAQIQAQNDIITAIDAQIDKINDNIQTLRDEQEQREKVRQITEIELGLEHDLYSSRVDLSWQMVRDLVLAEDLKDVYARLEGKTYDARDAILLLEEGLDDLADTIFDIVANPAIGSELPNFASGGIVPGPIGRPRLIVAHGGEEVRPAGRDGRPSVQLNQYNTINDRSPAAVEEAARRGGQRLADTFLRESAA